MDVLIYEILSPSSLTRKKRSTFSLNNNISSLFKIKNINEVNKERQELEKAAEGFEAMFTKFLYNKLSENTMNEDITGKVSNARKIFNNMLTDEFSELASQKGGLGLKELILNSYGFEPIRQKNINGFKVNNPVIGKISSDFGTRIHPVSGQKSYHYGIDIVPDPNIKDSDLIKTPLPGKVMFSGSYGSFGKVILVIHPGGYKTLYAHNDENFVNFGDDLKKGQVIGRVGSTGISTGKHLHFELRKDYTPLDPASIL